MDKNNTLAIDFDGVIHSYDNGWMDGSIYGKPTKECSKYLSILKEKGYYLVIFTTRKDTHAVQTWLDKHKLNKYIDGITNTKPLAKAYIDDRGIRFTNWRDINNYF